MLRNKDQELSELNDLEEQLKQVDLQCQQWKDHLVQQYDIVFNESDTWTSTFTHESDEATQVINQLNRQEQLKEKLWCQLREARVRQESAEIIQAWEKKRDFLSHDKAEAFPVDATPLFVWYLKLRRSSSGSNCAGVETQGHKGKILAVPDKICYDLKYDNASQSPLSMGSSHRENIHKGSQKHPLLAVDWREMLSFSTRRDGYCVNVVAGKFIRNLAKTEQTHVSSQLPEHLGGDTYTIRCDPHIEGVEEHFTQTLLQRSDPVVFIMESIWRVIDSRIR